MYLIYVQSKLTAQAMNQIRGLRGIKFNGGSGAPGQGHFHGEKEAVTVHQSRRHQNGECSSLPRLDSSARKVKRHSLSRHVAQSS